LQVNGFQMGIGTVFSPTKDAQGGYLASVGVCNFAPRQAFLRNEGWRNLCCQRGRFALREKGRAFCPVPVAVAGDPDLRAAGISSDSKAGFCGELGGYRVGAEDAHDVAGAGQTPC
jgi:hypothetical protein